MKKKLLDILVGLLLLSLIAVIMALPAASAPLPEPDWLTKGFRPFCQRVPEECAPYDDDRTEVELTGERFKVVDAVNRKVNRDITYKTDKEHFGKDEYFTYPTDGVGDCEDYALEKRRRLVAMGWPRRALLLAIVDKPLKAYQKTEENKNELEVTYDLELHMVLVLRTDQGNLVLDINHPDILPAYQTGYTYNWIQSDRDPNKFEPSPEIRQFEKDWKKFDGKKATAKKQ